MAYASPDGEMACALHDALVARGLRVCFDQASLSPGDNWYRMLPQWVEKSSIVVALLSQHSEQAHFQHAELVQAIDMVRQEQARLIPVRLTQDAWIPYGLEVLQRVDMFDPAEAPALAARIAALVPAAALATGVVCSRIPPVPKHFTGRDQLLAKIAASQHTGGSVVVTQMIQGLGGVGKTSLAAAVAHAHQHDIDLIWWVRAEDTALLTTDMAELAPHLGVPESDSLADTAAAVRMALERTDRTWLVVFDNAVSDKGIDQWLPLRGNGTVVITSRSRDFPNADEIVPVDVFPPDIAAAFLRNRVRRDNPTAAEEDLTDIINRLDGLPLALEHAAAWVSRVPERRFAQFVAAYDDHDPFDNRTRPRGYTATATTTWQVSIDAATDEAPLAERVLWLLGFLAPEPLPTQWLRDMGDDDYFDHSGSQAIDDALAALHAYSLTTITSEATLTVHRVVQSAARRDAPPHTVDAALITLCCQLPDDHEHPHSWPLMALLSPHALALAEHELSARPTFTMLLVVLISKVAHYQRVMGAVQQAVMTATTAYDLATEGLDDDGEITAFARNALALALYRANDLQQALPLLTAAVASNEQIFGPDHPDTLTSRNNLADAYRAIGEIDRAIALHEPNLADCERVLGPDHPDTLTSRNNLALAHRASGDIDRAIALHEPNLADRERILGPDHPSTLESRNNLAENYLHAGDIDRAIALHEPNLADCERVFGPDHPNTLTSRNNLALAYQADGHLGRAITLLEGAVTVRERILGPDHPDTLTSRRNLLLARLAELAAEQRG